MLLTPKSFELSSSDDFTTFRQFTSATMTRMLFHERNITKTAMKPIVSSHFASVLFADISGFTRASASFTQDQLCKHINNYFTQILSIIDEHNGDVVKFCGDALMIIWPVDHNASALTQEATVQLATACGLHLLRESPSWNKLSATKKMLGLHCGVSVGQVHCMCLGERERWEFVVSGDAIGRVGDACSEAKNGELCLTAEAYELIAHSVEGVYVENNCFKIDRKLGLQSSFQIETPTIHNSLLEGSVISVVASDRRKGLHVRTSTLDSVLSLGSDIISASNSIMSLDDLKGDRRFGRQLTSPISSNTPRVSVTMPKVSIEDAEISDLVNFEPRDNNVFSVISDNIAPINHTFAEARDFLLGFLKPGEAIPLYKYDGMDEVLRCFVHESARESVESGTTSLMGELRVVVTIFFEILGLDKDFRRGSIRRPQKVMRFMLACLKQFGGALRQYIVDDKGCVMIAGFGLPGYAHVDSCARAVETAVAFRRLLKASRLDCKIGISEGCVYCGLVGSSNRCEYSMMGASVNLAARMMGKCKAGQIIVDENVFTQTSETFKYSKLPKIKAKGYKMPIQVYCPTDRADVYWDYLDNDFDDDELSSRKVDVFVGREEEINLFGEGLDTFCKTNKSRAHVIEGKLGVGKSWLVGEVCYLAAQTKGIGNLFVVEAQSPLSYKGNRYESVRQLIRQIFMLKPGKEVFDPDELGLRFALSPDSIDEDAALNVPENLASASIDIQYEESFLPRKKLLTYMNLKSSRASLGSNLSDSTFEGEADKKKFSADVERAYEILGAKPRRHSENALKLAIDTSSPEQLILLWVQEFVLDSDFIIFRNNPLNCEKSVEPRSADESNIFYEVESSCYSDETLSVSERRVPMIYRDPADAFETRRVSDMIPLLNELLNVKLQMTDSLSCLGSEARSSAMEALLIFIIVRAIQKTKTILVVEHIQWCDSKSMAIFYKSIKKSDENLFFVATLRSSDALHQADEIFGHKELPFLRDLMHCCDHHILEPFNLEEIEHTLHAALNPVLSTSNPEIMSKHSLSIIMDRTDGSPMLVCCLCFEISDAVRSGSFVDIASLPCGRRDNLIDLFDLLSHSDQQVLKVAAVIGRSFTVEELCYLLAILGLSAFLVDLQAALDRMVETSFIQEDFEVNELQLSKKSRSRNIQRLRLESSSVYRFTNNSVHENVYNISLEEQRESAHNFLGVYYETRLPLEPNLFDQTVFHFIRSSNNLKKIEYLCKAADSSRMSHRCRDVYYFCGELVKLSTGLRIQDLLIFCCSNASYQQDLSSINLRHIVLKRMLRFRRTNEFPTGLLAGKKWIDFEDIKRPVYSILQEITTESVCRWIGEMGIILFNLGSLRMSSNLMRLSLHGMRLNISAAPEFWSTFEDDTISRTSLLSTWLMPRKIRFDLTAVPDDMLSLNLARIMMHHIAILYIMHGSSSISKLLDFCGALSLKISQTRKHKSTRFVDRFQSSSIEEDNYFHCLEQSLQRLAAHSFEFQTITRVANLTGIDIPKTDSVEFISTIDSINGSVSNTNVDQSVFGSNFVDKKESFQPLRLSEAIPAHLMDRIILIVEKAGLVAAVGWFGDCSKIINDGLLLLNKDSWGSTWRFLYLYQVWVSFLSGQNTKLLIKLQKMTTNVVILEENTLYAWILDLKSLFLVLTAPMGSAFTAVNDIFMMLKAIRKSDKPAACSSAVMALAFALDGRLADAVAHAKYAVQKLSHRHAVTLIGPIYIFIAAYAAAMVMELYAAAMLNMSRHDKVEADWFVDAQQRSQKALRRYEAAKECADMGLIHLRSVYKSSQPCIVTLYRALKIKKIVCDAILNKKVHTIHLKTMMSPSKTAAYSEFTLGNAFLRLEQANLMKFCSNNLLSNETHDLNYISTDHIEWLFTSLGFDQIDLFKFCAFFRTAK